MICGIKSETACFSVTWPYIFVVSIYTYAYVILWLFEQRRNRSLVHTEASFYLAELTFTNMEWYAALRQEHKHPCALGRNDSLDSV